MASRFIYKNTCRCFIYNESTTFVPLSHRAHQNLSLQVAMTTAPLQSAMSYLNTLLAQPPAGFQQKPLPDAPSAPVTITQPPSKPSSTMNDPTTNAFTSLLSSSLPINPASNLCEVRMAANNYCSQYSCIPNRLVTFAPSLLTGRTPTISARNGALLQRRVNPMGHLLENRAKVL